MRCKASVYGWLFCGQPGLLGRGPQETWYGHNRPKLTELEEKVDNPQAGLLSYSGNSVHLCMVVLMKSVTLSSESLIIMCDNSDMLAILEQWEEPDGHHTDNTRSYLFLTLFKLVLEILILNLCWSRLHTSFLGVCSLSVFLVDAALAWVIATLWFLGPDRSPVTVCFVLAHASSVYAMLPLPALMLGLLDYLHEPRYSGCHAAPCRTPQNCVLALLVWVIAGVCSFCSTNTTVMETEYEAGKKALICQMHGSNVISFFCVGLFVAVCCVLLPFSSRLLKWQREANRLCAKRNTPQNPLESDLHFCRTKLSEPGSDAEKAPVVEPGQPTPPLYVSLTLCFAAAWTPYLVISIACQLMDFMIPAYITVNLLWFECAKSLLVGVVFWLKNDNLGPYSDLPDDVCQWGVYWNLSKGPKPAVYQDKHPKAVFCLSAEDRNTLLHA